MSRAFLIAAFAVIVSIVGGALAGCSDMFSPPQLPDLGKTPYDFGVAVPPYTGGSHDMAGNTESHDLANAD